MRTPMAFPTFLEVLYWALIHSSTKEKGGGKPNTPGHEITVKYVLTYFYGMLFCLNAQSQTAPAGMWGPALSSWALGPQYLTAS